MRKVSSKEVNNLLTIKSIINKVFYTLSCNWASLKHTKDLLIIESNLSSFIYSFFKHRKLWF
ncbi:MAG: hypothetical protein EBZ93_08625 [Actinobacteria bacterium]|nr:hypothetical protein [Actinomycetota bacterium]